MTPRRLPWKPLALAAAALSAWFAWPSGAQQPAAAPPVSYHQQVQEVFRTRCQGCHQPANKLGELVLTSYADALKGGKSGPLLVAGKPDDSRLIAMVTGPEPKMPVGGPPLSDAQVTALRRWIAQGARDDTPRTEAVAYTAEKPPVYQAAPVITAMALSPDGQTLAVSGFHEVLLRSGDGAELRGRLIGDMVRIDALAWSPDGTHLAAVGGSPAVFGEVQLWNVAARQQVLAQRLTLDTIFSVAFAPEGDRIAIGCVDNSIRVLSVPEGKELYRTDYHNAWPLDLFFTRDGLLVSCGTDRVIKVAEAKDGLFLDDANKLYLELTQIAYHPTQSWVAAGGEERIPRLFRFGRTRRRVAQDYDFNLLQTYERQPGPIHALAISPDGKSLAVASVGDEVRVYSIGDAYPADGENADLEVARRFVQGPAAQPATERAQTLTGHHGATFSIVFSRDGEHILTGGFDGMIRVFNSKTGEALAAHGAAPLGDLAAHAPR